MHKTWFITGASRGLGLEIARAALRAGHRVVATGRKRSAVSDQLGPDSERVMAAELDVTEESQARRVVDVEPGPFRTDFLTSESLPFGSAAVSDYDDRRVRVQTAFEQRRGRQPGDPAKLGDALVRLAREANPPLRFAAGAFAIGTIDRKLAAMKAEYDSWRQLAAGTDF